jgi:hypothetical protein
MQRRYCQRQAQRQPKNFTVAIFDTKSCLNYTLKYYTKFKKLLFLKRYFKTKAFLRALKT